MFSGFVFEDLGDNFRSTAISAGLVFHTSF